MKKIFLLTVSLVFSVTHSAQANDQTNDLNMSGSAVKIIKIYPGSWKGWADGCVNCDKPLASDNVKTKRVRTKHKKTKSDKGKKTKVRREVAKSMLRGYCECNCKPVSNKEIMNNNSHRVFGAKDSGNKDNSVPIIKQPNDKLEEIETEKEKSKDKKTNEGKENRDNTQSQINEKIIKIFSLWKS